ncbi:hypothetical protein [Roseivivax isoporae]|uniref:CNNM transmembrane domain-containing protein n=1 Tax=Roseivivax isoporae LMG 25204 TaxID=1449351 RepID=X7FBM7_9RHOB|nr:hypothetical protein [Roseivivax isoporae]ETX30312.1 hypothetical protein RISW2_15870 [Roseivivax isoporae LMG 25204]
MPSMLLAFVSIFVIAFGAEYGLEQLGLSSAATQSADSVRLE